MILRTLFYRGRRNAGTVTLFFYFFLLCTKELLDAFAFMVRLRSGNEAVPSTPSTPASLRAFRDIVGDAVLPSPLSDLPDEVMVQAFDVLREHSQDEEQQAAQRAEQPIAAVVVGTIVALAAASASDLATAESAADSATVGDKRKANVLTSAELAAHARDGKARA